MCIVGTDRTLSNGDVCNKIGTYLKALAAKDNNIPFYVALSSSTIDWKIKDLKFPPNEGLNTLSLLLVKRKLIILVRIASFVWYVEVKTQGAEKGILTPTALPALVSIGNLLAIRYAIIYLSLNP